MTLRSQRIIATVVLVAYLGFAVWTFFLSKNAAYALYVFVPVSALLWIVLRALRGKT